jgi:N-acetylmuramoyl-L-alanine amidase
MCIRDRVKEALVDSQNIDKVIYKNGAIEVYLKNQSTYLVGGEGNKTNISFMKDIQEKLEYKDGIVIAKNGKNIDLNKVKFEENPYINLTRVILNDNYSSILKSGSLNINDTKTKKIDIKNISGKTTIEIYGNDLYVYKITEDEKNVYIKAFKPKDIYKNVIIIDAGHGGKDPGAVSGKDTENEYNMKIMNNLKEMLTKENIKVYYTREIDIFKTLDERVQLVNKIKPDMFLSIHNNTTFSKKIKGTEVLYYPGTMNKKLAEVIQKNVVKYANTYNRGIKQRDRLYILKHSKYPSVIAEIAYMSNVEDKKKLDTDSFLKSAAEGLYRGIKEYLKIN